MQTADQKKTYSLRSRTLFCLFNTLVPKSKVKPQFVYNEC